MQNSNIKYQKSSKNFANFLFEAAVLKRLKRTGWQILGGDNQESIAEHSYMVSVISLLISDILGADKEKVLTMSLFHDFSEGRTGDVYKLADFYVNVNEKKANEDAFHSLPNSSKMIGILEEYKEAKTLESKIVHDADVLALMIELKILIENGNRNAGEWFEGNLKRLKLKESQKIGREIEKSNSQNWWKKERSMIHKGEVA